MPARIVLVLGVCVANAATPPADHYPPFSPGSFQKKVSHPLITPEVANIFEHPIADNDEQPQKPQRPHAKPWMQQANPWTQTANAWAAAGRRAGAGAAALEKPAAGEEKVVKIQEKDTCSFREREVLKPVLRLSTRISGSVSSNSTVRPQPKLSECQGGLPMARLRSCYYAVGFTKPTAECWAQEQFNLKVSCGGVCYVRKDPVDPLGPGQGYNMMGPGSPVYQLAQFMQGIEQFAKSMQGLGDAGEKVTAAASAVKSKGMWGALSDMVTDTLLKGFDKGASDSAPAEVSKMVAKIPEQDLQAVIWSADTNGDGKVTTEEVAAAIGEADDTMEIDHFTGKFVEKSPDFMEKKTSLRQQRKPNFVVKLTKKLGRLMRLMGGEAMPPKKQQAGKGADEEEEEEESGNDEAPKKQFYGYPGWWGAGQMAGQTAGKPKGPWAAAQAEAQTEGQTAGQTAGQKFPGFPGLPGGWAQGFGNQGFGKLPNGKDRWTGTAPEAEAAAADEPKKASDEAEAGAEAQGDDNAAAPAAHVPNPIQGMQSFACQHCMARLRQLRRTCLNTAMRISESCQSCQIEAYKFYDATCMMPCINVFGKPEHQQKECRVCNDQFNEMMAQCGL